MSLLAASPGQAAAQAANLYEASVIVTGMDLRGRPAALSRAFGQVLAKVSGNPAWLDDARAAAADPLPLLRALAYLDRDTNLPKHDEQGTRDRPYDLIAAFDPAALDAQLRAWGDRPWPEPRPLLTVDAEVTTRTGEVMPLRADTDPDERHRGALLAAAARFGVTLFLPATIAPSPSPPGGAVLRGTLRWSAAEFGWTGDWSLLRDGQASAHWGLHGVGFDEAYRDAVAGAARLLSGH